MSKQKSSAKTLIIEDDEVQEDGDELNPFSFKEFIRSKNKGPETHMEPDDQYYPSRKTYGSLASDRDYPPQRHPDAGPRLLGAEPWLSPGASPGAEPEEEEWSGSYEPAALEEEESREFSSTYSGPSSLGAEDDASWREQGEEPSLLGEEPSLLGEESVWREESQRGPADYEGDDETSMVEPLAYRSPNGRPEPRKTHLQRMQDENTQLRRNVKALLKKADNDERRLRELTDELHKRRLQEQREAQALESMVHSVEQNLLLMTKRAVKAENNVTKLKQELHNLQSQVESYRCENEQLRAGETAALNTMKQNAQVASQYLNTAALNAETSIKQLLTGAETLCLVSQLLHSIDKISEFQGEG